MTVVLVPDPVASLIEAVNRNDVEAFLGFFVEDGEVDDWGRRFRGHAAIRGWSDREFIGVQAQLVVHRCTRAGNRINVDVDVTSKGFNGPSPFSFAIAGDRIRQMRIRSSNVAMSLLLDVKSMLIPPRSGP